MTAVDERTAFAQAVLAKYYQPSKPTASYWGRIGVSNLLGGAAYVAANRLMPGAGRVARFGAGVVGDQLGGVIGDRIGQHLGAGVDRVAGVNPVAVPRESTGATLGRTVGESAGWATGAQLGEHFGGAKGAIIGGAIGGIGGNALAGRIGRMFSGYHPHTAMRLRSGFGIG